MGALLVTAVVAALAGVVIMLIILNLSSRDRYLQHRIKARFGVDSPQFGRAMGCLLGPPISRGNRVETLVNGAHYFPAMLEAIRGAQRSITFETFIYWSGEIGQKFTDALIERAEAGVRTYLLVDWFGSWKMEKALVEQIRRSPVCFAYYRPPNWHNLLNMNNRTHRKLLVVDGKVGFTGGAGIADAWDGNAGDTKHWRDTQFRLEGPAVAQMQAAFVDNWMQTRSEVLLGDDFFPSQEKVGSTRAQVFMSGPGEGSESSRLMHLVSITCAQKSVRLAQSYFVPDSLSVQTLVEACRRGVRVEIIVQGPTDAPLTRRGGRSRWKPLLEAGAEIYEYQPAMYHCKSVIVDALWSSVGSVNFDNRSFRLNDEANLNVLDAEFAERQIAIFEADKALSRRITWEEYCGRPAWDRAFDWFIGLFRTQL